MNVTNTLQSVIIDFRKEPVPHFCKESKKTQIEKRRFNKETSVFAKWKEDTKVSLRSCLTRNDFKYWKVNRFIKEEHVLDDIKMIISTHISDIKNLQIGL